jgi:hypothetical protein
LNWQVSIAKVEGSAGELFQSYYRRECAEAGADFFLNKSTEFEKINEILARIVQADLHSDN